VKRVLRNAFLDLATAVMRGVLGLLSPVFPQSRSVVVSVFPANEGNGVEVARALVRRYDGKVVWLEDGRLPSEVAALVPDGLAVVPKASLRGLLAYLRAEAVFFTHGLYGSPRPSRRKPVVNIWHGDGPKDIRPGRDVGGRISSTYLVGSSRLFSAFKAEALDVPPERLLLTGNPRTDQLWEPPSPDALARLGISGDFVVWMPTFRQARAVGAVRTRAGGVPGDAGADELGPLVSALADRQIQLVVKPHPMDADRRRVEGVVSVSDEDLVRAGVPLYGLLGQARGLVTDYSSVWVDFLLLDRPVAFLVTDRDRYDRRLLPADVLDWVPGEVVRGAQPTFGDFLADLDAGGALGAERRARVTERIGLNRTRAAADGLLDELAARGVLGLRSGAGGPDSWTGESTSLLGRR
jgi:hypothetical protein